MSEYYCPQHPATKLAGLLRGGAGFCHRCGLYTQAAGVEMPARPTPRPPIEESRRIKSRLARARRRAKPTAATGRTESA